LNLKRVDPERIRRQIYTRVFNYVWGTLHKVVSVIAGLLLASLLTILSGVLLGAGAIQLLGLGGVTASVLGSLVAGVYGYFTGKQKIENEPANVSLGDYLDIPDYKAELGAIHHIEADMRRVLESVPQQHRPIVIFIDDIDRCSPDKVAQVFEGINLFLGGELPNCIFVLGMDTEMVAAALQAAHREMISYLPEDAGIPVGWRFMDKFVQLPFAIPPAEGVNIQRYLRTLFSTDLENAGEQIIELANDVDPGIQSREAIEAEVTKLQQEHDLDDDRRALLIDRVEAQVVQRKMAEDIERFNDRDPEIQKLLIGAATYFTGNPRELKRFVNAYRLQRFLWLARRAQSLDIPTLDQLLRWTILSMKWPEVVRWLRRGDGTEWRLDANPSLPGGETMTPQTRLMLLEMISGEATTMALWQEKAEETLRITLQSASWLSDDELLHFLHEGFQKYPAGDRLSDGAGKGLW